MCLFCWTQRKIFWRMRETEQFWIIGASKQPDYKLSSKYLPLCSEQTHSYRFGSTWGRVNDDRIFIFGWTVSLNQKHQHTLHMQFCQEQFKTELLESNVHDFSSVEHEQMFSRRFTLLFYMQTKQKVALKLQKHIIIMQKSPCDSCTIFQVLWWDLCVRQIWNNMIDNDPKWLLLWIKPMTSVSELKESGDLTVSTLCNTHTHTHTHTHVRFCEKWGHPIGVMVFILYKLYVLLPYTYPTPKLSPHRRLCISTFPKKTSLCMIYKRFEKWGHGSMSWKVTFTL